MGDYRAETTWIYILFLFSIKLGVLFSNDFFQIFLTQGVQKYFSFLNISHDMAIFENAQDKHSNNLILSTLNDKINYIQPMLIGGNGWKVGA